MPEKGGACPWSHRVSGRTRTGNQVFSPFSHPTPLPSLQGRNLEDLIPYLSGFLRFGEQQTKELQAPIPDTHPPTPRPLLGLRSGSRGQGVPMAPGHPRPGPARQPPLPTSWAGISGDTCLSPSPGPPTLTASSPHTPTPVGRSPLQAGRGRLLPVRQLRGKGRKREGAQTCQTPPSLSDKEGQACSWSPPSGGLAMESKHSRPQGQGTKAWGRRVSLRVTSYTGNFGDRGALGHSPL